MDLPNSQKDAGDQSPLWLVPGQKDAKVFPCLTKQFVNFMFFRVNPDWRKLDAETKRSFKTEFQNVYREFDDDFLLFSYSLVGFDSKADLMFWRVGTSLDLVQEMTANGLTRTVANTDMKVRTVHGYSARKTDDLKMSIAGAAVGLVGKPDIIMGKASNTTSDPACPDTMLVYIVADLSFKILARLQSECMYR